MLPKGKPKATRKQGQELRYECPHCGSGSKNPFPFEINITTGLASCLRCGYTLPKREAAKLRQQVRKDQRFKFLLSVKEEEPRGVVGSVPSYLHRIIEEREMDPTWLIRRYKVGWDGSRLCFPCGKGFWRRAVYPGQLPKVLVDPEAKGEILGEHLLPRRGGYVVLTEGDYKAASIPLPYIGVAIGGRTLSSSQLEILRWHKPKLIYVMLDGGVNPGKIVNSLNAALLDAVPVTGLPQGKGPDDVPMPKRHELLDAAYPEEE